MSTVLSAKPVVKYYDRFSRSYRHPMADFVRAVATADIPDDKGRLWRHGDKRIALFRTP